MLLRASISNTKKFLKKTICNFKSFFSNSYHRLPKTPPRFAPGPDIEKSSTFHFISSQKELQSGSFTKNNSQRVVGKSHRSMNNNNIRATHHREAQENCEESCSKYDERRMCLVAKKIKELEKLDARNVDHALDIEEILHYYTRLTCPAYIEIVDRFFVEIFAEFSAYSSSQPCGGTIKSRLIRPESVGLVKRSRSPLEKSSSHDFF